jgi:hypothetical protein
MNGIIPIENITGLIYLIRGKKVMLDQNLAILYGVETKRLKEQVRRNIERFPEDFMFELSKKEYENLRSQFATSSWGGTRYAPMAFTEHGVLMISSVLKSDRALIVESKPKKKIGFTVIEKKARYGKRGNRKNGSKA